MVTTARAAGLRDYPALVDELGGDGVALLGRFGISAAALADDAAIIPAESIGWAMEAAATELGCPDFGLRLAARQDTAVLGPLAVAVANAETVGAALDFAARFVFTHNSGISIRLIGDPEGQPEVIGLEYRDTAAATGFAQGVGLSAGTIHKALSQVAGADYGLLSIHLPHAPLAPEQLYVEYFGAPVVFESEYTVFRIPRELPARPIAGSNQTLRTMSVDYLTRNFSDLDHTMSARVRIAIEQVITTAKPDIGTVARALIMHERTLQRALAAEGTTFNEVLDITRRDTVYRLLRETDLPMSQITALAGLGGQSALTRVVRRWFGTTPQQIRNSARAQHGSTAGVRVQPVPRGR
ncbi:AraC family transcriptional regulator [Nocardia sp. NPDC057668]|uniref:AraC family transcriptional regulator n=1 Tax=Nocardia sp. NPDC057668 TaxID=3346202 RepID=UPI003671BE4C